MTRAEADYVYERLRQGRIKPALPSPRTAATRQFHSAYGRVERAMFRSRRRLTAYPNGATTSARPTSLCRHRANASWKCRPRPYTASATLQVVADIAEQTRNALTGDLLPEVFHVIIFHFCKDMREPSSTNFCESSPRPPVGPLYVCAAQTLQRNFRLSPEPLIQSTYYHAGLELREKTERQEAWHSGAVRVLVATTASEMGIH